MHISDIIKKGSTSRSVQFKALGTTDGLPTSVTAASAGIALWYRRDGGAVVDITESDLAAINSAFSAGGIKHARDGLHRLDLPDAAYATGANYVDYGGTATNVLIVGGRVKLVDYDPEDSVRMGLTALPNVVAGGNGGLPLVDANGRVKIQDGLSKNTALLNFEFPMYDATTGALLPGITDVSVKRDLRDGNGLIVGTIANVTEVGGGKYRCDFMAADRNPSGTSMFVEVTGTGAKTRSWTWIMGA